MISPPLRQAGGLHRSSIKVLSRICLAPPATLRPASLSAIHRGLRRSERVQYGSPRSETKDSFPRNQRRRHGEEIKLTEKALEGASSKRQRLKLLRKLKRKQEEVDGTGKQTRRKRFVDPTSDFGKQSLVYHLKHGSLKDLTNKIDPPVRPRSFRERRREEFTGPDHLFGRTRRLETEEREGDQNDDAPYQPRRQNDGRRERRDWKSERSWESERSEETADAATPSPRPRKGNMMAITLKYTTAASQFLYGKSVVKAALEQARRKLYNLYIYAGEKRQDTKDVDAITRLAQRHGVPITKVPNEDQRLMDKMSMGRPHNGVVLETSPLPQPPVASLGKLEETASRLGFHVELDRQTKEEEDVNGSDTFIRRSRDVTARPLVLLLHEILDPGNLGAMLRTASYLGVDAVGITNRNSSHLTPVVLKSAAGAVEEISIFTIDSPAKFIEGSRAAGWKSYAAVAPPSRKFAAMHSDKFVSTGDIEAQSPLSDHPCILILGNEGYGLPKQIKVAADYELSVPRFVHESSVDSLNVSVATGLLCHAFVKKPPRSLGAKRLRDKDDAAAIESESENSRSEQTKQGDVMF